MLSAIAKPFGVLLMWLYEVTKNYGVAIILFGLIVKLILLPFQVKSKKSMMRSNRLQPQLKELEKQYGHDQQKYQLEIQKLYKENNVNPMSGCLWSLIPFPIMLALYQAIRFPLTIMMGVPKELLAEGGAIAEKLSELNFSTTLSVAYEQIAQSQFITEHFSEFANLSDKLKQISYNFLGINLGRQPSWRIWSWDWSNSAEWGQNLALFFIPILAAVITVLSTKLAQGMNPTSENGQDQTADAMKGLNYSMPIMTLIFGFWMPAAIGLYWIVSMGLGAVQDFILNKKLKEQMAVEEAEYKARMAEKEARLEAKRKATEQLYAENGGPVQNKNTSKSKIQKNQRDAQKAKEAEWEKRTSGEENTDTQNASRIGKRPYARGRNYDPDRYNRNIDSQDE